MRTDGPRVAILLAFSGSGGVERMVLNLIPGFLAAGIAVDLLAIFRKAPADLLRLREMGVRVIDLGVKHTGLSVPSLIRYLRAERPDAFLAAKDRAIRSAALARRLSGVRTRLVGRLGTHLSASLQHRSALGRWLRTTPMRLIYPLVDRIVANAEGVAEDTVRVTGLPAARMAVIRNPVVTPELLARCGEAVDHPFFRDDGPPVVLGVGRLTRQKDFATLLRAFARVAERRECRLVILGEGRERRALERLAGELGIRERVALPGFVPNPYAFMAQAALFVLSSRWEGSPNVLTEALAVGTPVVATDCPSGPAEILEQGRYGPLVPVGDSEALAEAMLGTLDHPLAAEVLRQAVVEYAPEKSARRYLEVLGLVPPTGP